MLLVMMLAGCTNDNLSEITGEAAALKNDPASLKVEASGLAGPLFDLETTPNGNILVADATRGITDLYGNVEVALPGATSVSSVGQGMMWVTTGPEGEGINDERQRLYRVNKNRVEQVVNLFEFESTNNPAGASVDSNPFSVKALNGNEALVADSGANVLLRIDKKGNIEVLAIFPSEEVSTDNIKSLGGCPESGAAFCNLPPTLVAQPVPTSIAIGPDGYYYVGELKGFPAPTGESNIWRISPDAMGAECGSSGDCVKLFEGGFTSIIDMAFGDDGKLYVAEMDANSWFAVEAGLGAGGRIKVCDPQTLTCEVVAEGIPILTSIVFDKEGNLWATRNALVPGGAEVVKIPL